MLKWKTVEDEIVDLLNADTFSATGKWNKYLFAWGGRLAREIAQEMDIREHFQTCTISLTTADNSVVLPGIFFKVSDRFTKVRISGADDDSYIPIVGLDTLLGYDPDRDETTTGNPDAVAIEGGRLYPYPLFTGTLILENYLREPTAMADRNSTVDLPYDETLHDLLLNGVAAKAFVWLQDFDMAKICISEYARLKDLYMHHIDKSYSKQKNEATFY